MRVRLREFQGAFPAVPEFIVPPEHVPVIHSPVTNWEESFSVPETAGRNGNAGKVGSVRIISNCFGSDSLSSG
jgi:hypothetical protein